MIVILTLYLLSAVYIISLVVILSICLIDEYPVVPNRCMLSVYLQCVDLISTCTHILKSISN